MAQHQNPGPAGLPQPGAPASRSTCNDPVIARPSHRKLRGYAFDPSLSLKMDTRMINDIIYKIPWEENLKPGPIGEYLEVVDYDPTSRSFYKPVDLNDRYILAQDGIAPDESNPQFHQQMVYAVAMTTIRNFEMALGRKISWSSHSPNRSADDPGTDGSDAGLDDFTRRLRIYPHALREANAYYSPLKKAVLFGYFNATPSSPQKLLPGGIVYTCLSHDIIVHEVTHALLDGMHRRYIEATHRDSLAFHEAFADIVALFQHFSFPDVLKQQIAETRGDLASQNMLGKLAQQFGQAIGHYGALRDALGKWNEETGVWEPQKPDPEDYLTLTEAHERGSILVAAVFDAFINIYRSRVADLLRIATGGTGILPAGQLAPDLVNRMASEASKSASHVLRMCIRALDYCPPVDINFGDYLRAIITADYDLVADDDRNYRLAFIEAFQRRGIYPEKIRNMSVESLLCKIEEGKPDGDDLFDQIFLEHFKKFKDDVSYATDRANIHKKTREHKRELHKLLFLNIGIRKYILKQNKDLREPFTDLQELTGLKLELDDADAIRKEGFAAGNLYYTKEFVRPIIQKFTARKLNSEAILDLSAQLLNLLNRNFLDRMNTKPRLEIHNLKLVSRVGPHGNIVNQILVTLTQKQGIVCDLRNPEDPVVIGYFVPGQSTRPWYNIDTKAYSAEPLVGPEKPGGSDYGVNESGESGFPIGWFVLRTGCTIIFDLDNPSMDSKPQLKYIIKKPYSPGRIRDQYRMLFGHEDFSLNATYFGAAHENLGAEPFAMIHKIL